MTQYIEIHKAKSIFTPNAFVHNIISNSAAPIDTQITKNILTRKIFTELFKSLPNQKICMKSNLQMKLMLRIHGPKDWISLGSSERMTSFFSLKIRVCMNSAFQSSAAACKQKERSKRWFSNAYLKPQQERHSKNTQEKSKDDETRTKTEHTSTSPKSSTISLPS